MNVISGCKCVTSVTYDLIIKVKFFPQSWSLLSSRSQSDTHLPPFAGRVFPFWGSSNLFGLMLGTYLSRSYTLFPQISLTWRKNKNNHKPFLRNQQSNIQSAAHFSIISLPYPFYAAEMIPTSGFFCHYVNR